MCAWLTSLAYFAVWLWSWGQKYAHVFMAESGCQVSWEGVQCGVFVDFRYFAVQNATY